MNRFKQTFINRLKKARIEKNYSQEKLAENSGVTKTTISNYERGKNDPSLYIISRIARELDVSIDYLLGIEKYNTEEMSIVERYTYNKKALERLQKEQAEIEIIISQLNEIKENQ